MYRCNISDAASKPGEPLSRLVRYKPGIPRQIASEIPVCLACARQIEMGLSVADIEDSLRPPPPPEVQAAVTVPKPKKTAF